MKVKFNARSQEIDWVVESLEDFLSQHELAGEGNFPDWVTF